MDEEPLIIKRNSDYKIIPVDTQGKQIDPKTSKYKPFAYDIYVKVKPQEIGKFSDKKEVFPMRKKFDGDWYFFEEFTFSKEEALRIANGLKKAYPAYKDRIKAQVVRHGNDKLWAVYMRVE